MRKDQCAVEDGLTFLQSQFSDNFHTYLDHVLDAKSTTFSSLLAAGNTTPYWELLWDLVEHSSIAFSGVGDDPNTRRFCGRGRNLVTK